jgi:hypothetical protein
MFALDSPLPSPSMAASHGAKRLRLDPLALPPSPSAIIRRTSAETEERRTPRSEDAAQVRRIIARIAAPAPPPAPPAACAAPPSPRVRFGAPRAAPALKWTEAAAFASGAAAAAPKDSWKTGEFADFIFLSCAYPYSVAELFKHARAFRQQAGLVDGGAEIPFACYYFPHSTPLADAAFRVIHSAVYRSDEQKAMHEFNAAYMYLENNYKCSTFIIASLISRTHTTRMAAPREALHPLEAPESAALICST